MTLTGSASVSVKIIRGNSFGLLILGAVFSGMTLMALTFAFNAHVLLSMIALIGGMLGFISLMVRNARYTVDSTGITEEIVPLWKRDETISQRFYTWSEMRSWKVKRDMARNLKEKVTLIITMDDGYKMRIHSGNQSIHHGAFHEFYSKLEGWIEKYNTYASPHSGFESSSEFHSKSIERKPGFYEKPIAHLIFWGLTLFTAFGIYTSFETGIFKWTYAVRWMFVVPGLIYMYYRIYKNPKG